MPVTAPQRKARPKSTRRAATPKKVEADRAEWVESLDALARTVERWCAERGWPTERSEREIDEEGLGRYAAPVLTIETGQGQDQGQLDPQARGAGHHFGQRPRRPVRLPELPPAAAADAGRAGVADCDRRGHPVAGRVVAGDLLRRGDPPRRHAVVVEAEGAMRRSDAHERLESSEREYRVAERAVAALLQTATADPARLAELDVKVADVRRCADRLAATYVVALYARFEAILRDYWSAGPGRRTRPPMEVLVARVAARRSVDSGTLAEADEVREYRNALVHENATARVFTLRESRSRLARFVSFLPLEW